MYDGSSFGWYLPISSMTLPSRFLRESTTTMRYCGTRTLPRRFKRILTDTAVVSPRMSCGGGGRDARVGHRTTISDGPCAAAVERDRACRTRPASLPDCDRAAEFSTTWSARGASHSRAHPGPPPAHRADPAALSSRRPAAPAAAARRLADLRRALGDPSPGHPRAAGPRQEARLPAAA